jgi:hypothetical protein
MHFTSKILKQHPCHFLIHFPLSEATNHFVSQILTQFPCHFQNQMISTNFQNFNCQKTSMGSDKIKK